MNIITTKSSTSVKPTTTTDIATTDYTAVEQHSLPKTLALHLIPGVIITTLFFFIAPPLKTLGFAPQYFTLCLCALLVLLPTFAHLLYLGKKRNGKLSLQGIVLYRQRIPWWQYIVIPLLMIVYALVATVLFSPVQTIITHAFSWWPIYGLRLDNNHYPTTLFLMAQIFYFVVNGFIAPIIEECYFRGYLLPRISRFGRWSPFISITLFSLYHLWQPWNNLVNIVLLWPLAYLPWKKKNVYLAIVLHASLNLAGMGLSLLAMMKH